MLLYVPIVVVALHSFLCTFTEFTKSLPFHPYRNLEVLENQTDGSTRGTLLWSLDETVTPFGSRLLCEWLQRPLLSANAIQERFEAVEELSGGVHVQEHPYYNLRNTLKNMIDLERALCAIYYRKCGAMEFVKTLQALRTVLLAVPTEASML